MLCPPRRLLTAALLSLAALAGALSPASGQQTTEQLLDDRRLEYKAARDSYESALSALRVYGATVLDRAQRGHARPSQRR